MMRRRCLIVAALSAVAMSARAAASAIEMARIDRLIQYVASRHDLKFVRNGNDYSCADAAQFLRKKMDSMGEHVSSAHDFIDQIASKSSTSGQLYLIRFPDGHTEPSARFLREELHRMDAGK
jgi:hypothetical protein